MSDAGPLINVAVDESSDHRMSSVKLDDRSELLHRQINPKFLPDGYLSHLVFFTRASLSTENLISVDRGSILDCEQSFNRARTNSLRTVGCCSVLVGECNDIDLQVFADPLDTNDAHACIDMVKLTRRQRETAAKQLVVHGRSRLRIFDSSPGT